MKRETFQEELYFLPYHWIMKGYLRVSMGFRNGIVINLLNRNAGQRVLDLGCGDGFFIASLKKRFKDVNVIGADYNLRALRFARIMSGDGPCIATSAVSLGLKNECFDAVVMLDVLEHLNEDDRNRTVDQVCAVLKKGGLLVVTVPSKRLPMDPRHYDHFSSENLKTLMERKFEDVKMSGCCLYLPWIHKITRFPMVWRIIYFIVRECSPRNAVTLIAHGKKKS